MVEEWELTERNGAWTATYKPTAFKGTMAEGTGESPQAAMANATPTKEFKEYCVMAGRAIGRQSRLLEHQMMALICEFMSGRKGTS